VGWSKFSVRGIIDVEKLRFLFLLIVCGRKNTDENTTDG
jgi:hypothetical protein